MPDRRESDSDVIGLRATLTSLPLIYGSTPPFKIRNLDQAIITALKACHEDVIVGLAIPGNPIPGGPLIPDKPVPERRFSPIPKALSNKNGRRFVLSSSKESHTSISFGPRRRRNAEVPENLRARLSSISNRQSKTHWRVFRLFLFFVPQLKTRPLSRIIGWRVRFW
ncbi:uncharacterized protein LY79DRAFT_580880 [Colletotrichum navitas]|uniref:Uncharacterized protein n=1 Tax=Colletotrichum navitas TaxID=681940 RepID=A0AAD8PVY0_9PEZI|nr:uncharacterized protein LY79DRAFT_580880 [Colletotrichum navitas]KAK1585650.1 hypothetical protein LY79DRAFT_580880 [Colletotrichum navitas]